MRVTTINQEDERAAFAERAAANFSANAGNWSYTDGRIEPGERLALRWGMGDDCVLVLTIGDDEPVVYGQIIEKEQE